MPKLRTTFLAALMALCTIVVAGAAAAAPGPPPPPHHGPPPPPPPPPHPGPGAGGQIYIDNNTAGVNTVGAFDRHPDGSLTPVPGSPFAVGGAGAGHATASQGSIQRSSDGKFLLVADTGSNQISVVRIGPGGSLMPTDLVSSNGTTPVSIAEHDGLVYVANAGDPNPNYTGFRLDAAGHLTAIAGSTVTLPTGSQPGDVLFNGDGRKLVGTRVATSLIDSYTVGLGGTLAAAPGEPFGAQGIGPFGSEFSPTNNSQLFVSNAHNGGTAGTVSAFADAPNGILSSIGTSPFADNQTAPCWVEITRDGKYLFAINTGNSTISSYSIAPAGSLTLIGSSAFKQGPVGPEDARLSPDGQTLWVVEAGINAIAGFSVKDGFLAELPSSATPGPAGATPAGIVVT
ncbi:MAG TPA: beta-propeller fold lactonase family protein [Gaiellaceae bacterium]|jgi:6-phosphogluconolactonase (cycloisomerase 2 family)|nr:beta-propeller fold lactonase family protein [Gaiellaceae bacterium]